MKKLIVVSVTSLALLLTGCGTEAPAPVPTVTQTVTATPTPTPTPTSTQQASDGFFTDLVRENNPSLTIPDEDIVLFAKSACKAFDRGVTQPEIVDVLVKNASSASQVRELTFIVGAGVVVYCPQHTSKVE